MGTSTPKWHQHLAESRIAVDHCLALDSNATMAWHTLGNILTRELNFDEAVGSFEKAYQTDPGNPETIMGVGFSKMSIGLNQQAQPYIERAIEQDPLCAVWYGILGGINMMLGDKAPAETSLWRCFDLGYWPAERAAEVDGEHSAETKPLRGLRGG